MDLAIKYTYDARREVYILHEVISSRVSDRRKKVNSTDVYLAGSKYSLNFSLDNSIQIEGLGLEKVLLLVGTCYTEDFWNSIIGHLRVAVDDIRNGEMNTIIF
jgi:hypothetical protein